MAYISLIIMFFLINLISALSLIFIERKEPTTTWAWLVILIALPGIGLVLYLLLGQNLSRQKIFREKKLADKIKRYKLRRDNELSNFSDDNEINENYEDLILMNYNHSGAIYTIGNEVKTYTNGEDKFKDLFEDIKNAKCFIHIEYYIFRYDNLGKALINELRKKVDDGLEVRLLIDGMGSKAITKKIIREIQSYGIKMSVFFPGILPHINTRVNYRNHRKIVVIDGKIGYVGGFNVGDEYINRGKQFKFWRDTHIRVRGDANQLTATKVTSDFFEAAVALGGDAKQVSNWLQGEVAQFLNAEGKTLEEIQLTPENLVEMIAIIEDGTISSKIAKKVFVHLAKNGGGAREYVEKAGLVQISDPEVLIPIIHQVFADNEAAVADFKSGKRNADKAFTGFLMKATKGRANPQVALKLPTKNWLS